MEKRRPRAQHFPAKIGSQPSRRIFRIRNGKSTARVLRPYNSAVSRLLAGKRVLVLGAETEIGRAVTSAVAEGGASVAAVAATSEAESAFAVQRLARRLSSGGRKVIAQAIDATNEAAVRVMVRQVSKELGGLDVVVWCAAPKAYEPADWDDVSQWMERAFGVHRVVAPLAAKELDRSGGGSYLVVWPGWVGSPKWVSATTTADWPASRKWNWSSVDLGAETKTLETIAADVLRAIAGDADSG